MKLVKIMICSIILFMTFFIEDVCAETYNQGIVKSYAVVRTEPRSDASSVKSDTNGTIGLYSPESVEIIGESGTYYKIKFLYGGFFYEGYIPKNNVLSTVYEIDENYVLEMQGKGFPEDYAKKIAESDDAAH